MDRLLVVQWTVCGVGATDCKVTVHNTVIQLAVCGQIYCLLLQ